MLYPAEMRTMMTNATNIQSTIGEGLLFTFPPQPGHSFVLFVISYPHSLHFTSAIPASTSGINYRS